MHATTDPQHACKGLKRQSASAMMAMIDATASHSWHLLRQCHCNRVMPPHFFAFAQTIKTNMCGAASRLQWWCHVKAV